MKCRTHVRVVALLSFGIACIGSGCGKQSNFSAANNTQVVCDPFNLGAQTLSSQRGVAGSVFTFESPQMYQYNNVFDLQRYGTQLNAVIFMGAIDLLPTRFTEGFPVSGGGKLLGPSGTPLTEFFSLHLEASIELSPSETAGTYQFALLSDDGAVLRVTDGGVESTLISDDGTHPASLQCASKTVMFASNTKLPIKLDYFQGPRDELAATLLWRKVPDSLPATLADAECGTQGSGVLFDVNTTPSTPTQRWNDLLSRGWSVVKPANYILPAAVGSNPCF